MQKCVKCKNVLNNFFKNVLLILQFTYSDKNDIFKMIQYQSAVK